MQVGEGKLTKSLFFVSEAEASEFTKVKKSRVL